MASSRRVEQIDSGDWIRRDGEWCRVTQARSVYNEFGQIVCRKIYYEGGGRIPLNRRPGDTVLCADPGDVAANVVIDHPGVGPMTRKLGLV